MGYGAFVESISKKLGCKFDKDLAVRLGVSAKQVSLWKTNKSAPRMKMLKIMIGLAGYTLDQCLKLPDNAVTFNEPAPDDIRLRAMIANEIQKQIRGAPRKDKKKQGKRRA